MVSSWWDSPGNGESEIRQVSVETLGSAVAAVMCAVRVDELLMVLKGDSMVDHD